MFTSVIMLCMLCRCHNEITMVKAAKLAHHRRKAHLAERIEALREWRFAQPPDEGGPDSPTQDEVCCWRDMLCHTQVLALL